MPRSRRRSPKHKASPKRTRRPSPSSRRRQEDGSQNKQSKTDTAEAEAEAIRKSAADGKKDPQLLKENERKEKIKRQALSKLPEFIKKFVKFVAQKEATLRKGRPCRNSLVEEFIDYWNKTIPDGVPVALDNVQESDLIWLNAVIKPFGYYFKWYVVYDYHYFYNQCNMYATSLRKVISDISHCLHSDESWIAMLEAELAATPPTEENYRFDQWIDSDHCLYAHAPALEVIDAIKTERSKSIFAANYPKFINQWSPTIITKRDANDRRVLPVSKTLEFIQIPVISTDKAETVQTEKLSEQYKEYLIKVKNHNDAKLNELNNREEGLKEKERQVQKKLDEYTAKLKHAICIYPIWWTPLAKGKERAPFNLIKTPELTVDWQTTLNQRIKQVWRLENCALWTKYITYRTLMETAPRDYTPITVGTSQFSSLYGKDINSKINEVFLFHGTNDFASSAINQFGFDPRIANHGGMFGVGIYFAEDIEKALQYVSNSVGGTVYITRVCLGRDYRTNTAMNGIMRPPCFKFKRCMDDKCAHDRFDSVIANIGQNCDLKRFREFIIYNSAQCYPEYVLEIG